MAVALITGAARGIGFATAQAFLWLGTQCPEYVNGTTLDLSNGSYPR